MKNQQYWKASKFVFKKGKLVASRDTKEVNISSRLMADLIAEAYDKNLRKHVSGRLLDLGCGKVPFFLLYKDLVQDSVCVDWGNTLHKNEFLDFELDLNRKLPFGDDEFDTILLSDVLEHLPCPEHAWKEVARVLALKGKVIVNVPFFYWLHEEPNDYYRYTEFALRRFVEMSGLELVQLDTIGGAPEIMADICAKNALYLPQFGKYLSIFVQRLALAFNRTAFGKKVALETSKKFPFGYFLIAVKPAKLAST